MSEVVYTIKAITKEVQHQHLIKVSRTFAFTIPFLPDLLADVVSNAYLLCRIADTIEDDPKASNQDKIRWLKDFSLCASSLFRDQNRVLRLQKRALNLAKAAKVDEYALLEQMTQVISRTCGYRREVLVIIARGVKILSLGMAAHLEGVSINSLKDVDSYCYSVAGVVGQMLAHLFAAYNRHIDAQKLSVLAVSFGEGLQLTNILKDRFADKEERDSSFLPKVSAEDESKQALHYAAITQGHLDDAIDFVLKIPRLDSGVRVFCLVNIIMAMLTLKKIIRYPKGPSNKLKISRRCVKASAITCLVMSRFNFGVKLLAFIAGLGNASIRRNPQELHDRVSVWNKGV